MIVICLLFRPQNKMSLCLLLASFRLVYNLQVRYETTTLWVAQKEVSRDRRSSIFHRNIMTKGRKSVITLMTVRGSGYRLVRQDLRWPQGDPWEGDHDDASHFEEDPCWSPESSRPRRKIFRRRSRAENYPEQERHFESGGWLEGRADFELGR